MPGLPVVISPVAEKAAGEGAMRRSDEHSEGLFSYVRCEARVPANHPLRPVRHQLHGRRPHRGCRQLLVMRTSPNIGMSLGSVATR